MATRDRDRSRCPTAARWAAFVALPEAGHGPGLLVLMEIFGVGAYIRRAAERLAELGYVALAPDLYRRTDPGLELEHDRAGLQAAFAAAGQLDAPGARAGLAHGARASARAAGGRRAERRARLLPRRLARILRRGRGRPSGRGQLLRHDGDDALGDDDRVSGRVEFHFGAEEPYIPVAQAELIAAAAARSPDWECHIQPDAGHAFDNHESEMFHRPQAAERAWGLTSEFLARELPISADAPKAGSSPRPLSPTAELADLAQPRSRMHGEPARRRWRRRSAPARAGPRTPSASRTRRTERRARRPACRPGPRRSRRRSRSRRKRRGPAERQLPVLGGDRRDDLQDGSAVRRSASVTVADRTAGRRVCAAWRCGASAARGRAPGRGVERADAAGLAERLPEPAGGRPVAPHAARRRCRRDARAARSPGTRTPAPTSTWPDWPRLVADALGRDPGQHELRDDQHDQHHERPRQSELSGASALAQLTRAARARRRSPAPSAGAMSSSGSLSRRIITPSASANRNVGDGRGRPAARTRPPRSWRAARRRGASRIRRPSSASSAAISSLRWAEREQLVDHHRRPRARRRGSPRSCARARRALVGAPRPRRSPARAARPRTSDSRRTTSTSSRSLVPK